MSVVLGLDLSLRRSGLALWRDGDMSTDHVLGYGIDAKSDLARIVRVTRIAEEIKTRIEPDRGELDLVVIERYLVQGRRSTASDADIDRVHAFVLNALAAWKIPFAYVLAPHLKAFATGKGNADKSQMVAHALAVGWAPANHDECDASWLASFGALHLGDPVPFEVTDWRLAGLEKVAWPKARVRA